MQREIKGRVKDIENACLKIAAYCSNLSYDEFLKDEMRQLATMRLLEIIGEASKKIPEDVRNQFTDIPWKKMSGLRDILIHAYETVDIEALWKICAESIPNLLSNIQKIK